MAENLNKEALTFAMPALWAPCDSIYAMYLLKSLNSSFVGWKVMILMTGLWELWETESEAILPSGHIIANIHINPYHNSFSEFLKGMQ